MNKLSVMNMALNDISQSMKGTEIIDKSGDVWVVTATRINNKKQRRLNRELGVTKLNMKS